MKLVHNTTRISDDTWKELIRFVKPSGVSLDGWRLQFQQGSVPGTSGRAWRSGRLHVRVGSDYDRRKPRVRPAGGGYMSVTTYTHLEFVVFTLAHELRHVWQYQNPRGRRVWGSRGQASERDADAYGIHMLREWRRVGRPELLEVK